MKNKFIILLFFWAAVSLHAQDIIEIKLNSADTFSKGPVLFNNTYLPNVMNDRVILQNKGTVPVTFGIAILTNTAGWMPVTGQPGAEQFRLFGLFHVYNNDVSTNDFHYDDIILSDMRMASSNSYAINSEDNSVKGYNVIPDREVNLVFRLDTPASTVYTNIPLKIRILIKAQLYVPPADEIVVKPAQSLLTPYVDGPNHTLKFPGLADYLGEKKVFLIRILDMNGRIVKEISDKNEWDGTDSSNRVVKSGVYIYQYRYKSKSINGLIVVALYIVQEHGDSRMKNNDLIIACLMLGICINAMPHLNSRAGASGQPPWETLCCCG